MCLPIIVIVCGFIIRADTGRADTIRADTGVCPYDFVAGAADAFFADFAYIGVTRLKRFGFFITQ